MAIVALSSHLDDAALSASASLSGGGATVLTVFAGMPPPGFGVSLWDRLTGASSSAVRQAERLQEDAEVMGLLGAHGSYLDEREAQFREAGVTPDIGSLAGQIAGHLSGGDELWLPAAIGRHGDHVITRDAGLRAAVLAGLPSVVMYADFPYVTTWGWPAWLTGHQADPYLDSEPWLDHELAAAEVGAEFRSAEVIRLDDAQRDVKTKISSAYRSQASALALRPADLAGDPSKLDFELFWRIRPGRSQ